MSAYLELQMACCKPSTVNGYRINLAHFHDFLKDICRSPAIQKKHIIALSKTRLQKYISYLNRKNLAPYTRVNYLLSVRKYLAWEAEQGTIKEDLLIVLDRKNLPKVPEYLPRPLSLDTDRHLQKRWRQSNNPYAKIFLFLRLTGLRIGELINLPTDCVITNSNNEKYLKVPLGKMNNERLVPLTDEVLSLIPKFKDGYHLYNGYKCIKDPNRLIGLRGQTPNVYKRLRKHFSKNIYGMTDQNKPITFHRLRHTLATSLLTGGMGLPSLMKFLGHKRIEMTLRYAKVTPSHLRQEYNKAIQTIEKQSVPTETELSSNNSASLHPAEIIQQLCSFLTKAVTLTPRQKKNLLLRLNRLKVDLNNISFSEKIKPELKREK